MPKLSILEFPSGRFGFVGSVPFNLAYINRDGSEPTEKQIDDMYYSNSESIGFNITGLRARVFETRKEIETVLKNYEKGI